MTSKTTLALAIALPLALLCIAFVIGNAVLLVRSGNQRKALYRAGTELAKVQKQLDAFPRPGSKDLHEFEFFREDIASAYGSFFVAVCMHIRKWVDLEGKSSPAKKDSVARIQAILFPKPPPSEPFNEGMDTTLFSNPHQYTVEELCSAIEARETRHDMFQYILISIMLKAVTLREDATSTLLPFMLDDVRSLAKIHEAIRTLHLSGRVSGHIANFWIYKSSPALNSSTSSTRSEYYKVVKFLFEPYFATDADMFQHQVDLNDVLDKATEFGKKVSGRAADHIETRWGKRDDVDWIVTYPALYAVEHVKGGRFVDHCLNRGAMYRASDEEIKQDMIRNGVLFESA
ncbi:hypothetical protein DL98DRAFT_279001 [Cadophora sp. DSE1049]|nr:hypothetical protein DL98DRAFT_279001 [Cadophora sp. DSE1049]